MGEVLLWHHGPDLFVAVAAHGSGEDGVPGSISVVAAILGQVALQSLHGVDVLLMNQGFISEIRNHCEFKRLLLLVVLDQTTSNRHQLPPFALDHSLVVQLLSSDLGSRLSFLLLEQLLLL